MTAVTIKSVDDKEMVCYVRQGDTLIARHPDVFLLSFQAYGFLEAKVELKSFYRKIKNFGIVEKNFDTCTDSNADGFKVVDVDTSKTVSQVDTEFDVLARFTVKVAVDRQAF